MKTLIVVITLLLASGCVATEQKPPNSIEFKSICGSMKTLVCMPQYRECWCEDPDKLQREMEQLLLGSLYQYS